MPGCWNKVGFTLMVKESEERLLRERRKQTIMELASHKAAKTQETFNAYIKTGGHYPTYLPPPRPRERPLTASACLHEIQQYMNFYNVMEDRDMSRRPGDTFYEGDWSIGDASSTTQGGVYFEAGLNQLEGSSPELNEMGAVQMDGTVDPPRPATTGSINDAVTRRTFHPLDSPGRQVRSGGGTRTVGRLGFTSGPMGLSTPLYSPATPPMPNIDDHVTVKEAKWSEVCMTLRQARSEHLTMRAIPKMPEIEDKKPVVSTDEMRLVFDYIDNFQGGDGLIEYGEMETAFRRARRARAAAALAQEGRKLLERLEKVFAFHGLTVKRFFFRLDINCNGQGDGKLSMSEIKRGLAHLTELEDLTVYRFTDHELQTLIRYMDPNADGTLTLGEMEDAFIRAHAPMQELEVQERVGRVIAELDGIMAKRKKRLIDLFRELDTDGSGAISLQELKEGLRKAAEPAPEVRARRKIRFKKDSVANQNDAMHRAQVDQIKARFRAAKDSGALPVLMRLEAYLHANKLRSRDIFTKAGFDTSGDGQVDAREFHQALERLNINIRKKEVYSVLAFLDVNHDNRIQPSELEGAMRDLTKAKALLQPRVRHSQLNKHHSHRLVKGDSLRRLLPIAPIPGPASRPRSSGKFGANQGMPDVRWLESFDHLMTHHLKKLTRCN